MAKGITISPSNYPREESQIKSDQEDAAVESLGKNGIDTCQFSKGNTVYQYILHPQDTRKGGGNFMWKLIDFLVNHRDFMVLRKPDFDAKVREARAVQRLGG